MNFPEAYGHSDLQWRLAAEMVRRQHAQEQFKAQIVQTLRRYGPGIMDMLEKDKQARAQIAAYQTRPRGGMIYRNQSRETEAQRFIREQRAQLARDDARLANLRRQVERERAGRSW